MGAWGTGLFEDDTSLDLIADVIETDAVSFVKTVISKINPEYLEYEQCQEVIVSGVIIDSILNETKYDISEEEFYEWISNQEAEELEPLNESIAKVLKLVISEKSELNELWSENEEDYPSWRKNIEDLIHRLG